MTTTADEAANDSVDSHIHVMSIRVHVAQHHAAARSGYPEVIRMPLPTDLSGILHRPSSNVAMKDTAMHGSVSRSSPFGRRL